MADIEPTLVDFHYRYGEPTLPLFGRTLAVARDLDGVAGDDLLIGAPTNIDPTDGGVVYALGATALRALLTAK